MIGGKNHLRAGVVIAVAAAALILTIGSCLDTGQTCPSNLTRCGTLCPDIHTDRTNCGGCGIACQIGQDCFDGGCVCTPGSILCSGYCRVPTSDPFNCGGCAGDGGVVCAPDQVCEQGVCRTGCVLDTSTRCQIDGGPGACVNTRTDPFNCGGCAGDGGVVCDGGHCDAGVCG
jgi:hypothetical protein